MQCQEEHLPGQILQKHVMQSMLSTDAMSKPRHQQLLRVTACQLLLIHGLFQQTAGSWFPLMAFQPRNIAIFYIHLSRGICFQW